MALIENIAHSVWRWWLQQTIIWRSGNAKKFAIRKLLSDRGILLNPPADADDLRCLEKCLGLTIPQQFKSLFETFDGFAEYDRRSHLAIWPVEKVVENSENQTSNGSELFIQFGDILIHSDILIVDISNENCPVMLQFEKKRLANSFDEFLLKFTSNDFDWQ
jgi:hypothetical protein